MEASSLTVEHESRGDGVVVVVLHGEVTFVNVGELERALDVHADRGVVIDMADVGFIDSSGISVLLSASLGARGRGREVAIVHGPGERPGIFDFKGVERLLRLYPSREAALAAL